MRTIQVYETSIFVYIILFYYNPHIYLTAYNAPVECPSGAVLLGRCASDWTCDAGQYICLKGWCCVWCLNAKENGENKY